jgi:3-phosphoshikimate 1-carboxyvinyltransferase
VKSMHIAPVSELQGEVDVPGDKSISHRHAILGALANGVTRIANYSPSQDCSSTLDCLAALGVKVAREASAVSISSPGWNHLSAPRKALDAGNSGTTIRLLAAVLAARPFQSMIEGDASLNRRPMRRIIDPLARMGATICAREDQYPPLAIKGGLLRGIRYPLPIASAQVKSCVLLAGLLAEGITTVVEPAPSRDHTERAFPFFGAQLRRQGVELSVEGGQKLSAAETRVPGDFSGAVFFIVAALLIPNAVLRISKLGINPTRTGLLDLLRKAGADLEFGHHSDFNGEPVADLTVRYSRGVFDRFPAEIGGSWIPNLIDEIPALSVLGTRLSKGLRIQNAQELRKKESDRISAIVGNLARLGIQVEESGDGLYIPPGQRLRGGKVATGGDHRIAMAFAVAGLIAEAPVELDDPACCAVSFPGFFDALHSITR